MSHTWASQASPGPSSAGTPAFTPSWARASNPSTPSKPSPMSLKPSGLPDTTCITCNPPQLSSFCKKVITPEVWARNGYVWATHRPRRRSTPQLLFLGLDNSGKTSIIHSLLSPAAGGGSGSAANSSGGSVTGGDLPTPATGSPSVVSASGTLPAAPPPTAQAVKYTVSLDDSGAHDFVAVDLPGALSKRGVWLDALRQCDAVVLVVDSADSLRFRVVRAELHRIMPLVQRRALPCLVLATKQDLFTARSKDEVLHSTSLAQMCSHLPAPWTLKPCSVLDTPDIAAGLRWLLGRVAEMRGLVGDAARREKHIQYQARNLSFNLSKLQEGQDASYIKATTWQ